MYGWITLKLNMIDNSFSMYSKIFLKTGILYPLIRLILRKFCVRTNWMIPDKKVKFSVIFGRLTFNAYCPQYGQIYVKNLAASTDKEKENKFNYLYKTMQTNRKY